MHFFPRALRPGALLKSNEQLLDAFCGREPPSWMRLYYFTPLTYARLALQNRRIKIARVLELNDPYELLGADLTDDELRVGYEAMRNNLADTRGLICFSRQWSVPIMWSHYADRHRGVCLGFDVSDSHTISIQYAEQRVSFTKDMLGQHDAEKHMMRFLGTKHSAWTYEDEVRVICNLDEVDDGLYFHAFDDDIALREVLMGVQCTECEVREFIDLVGSVDPAIAVCETRLSNSAFELVLAVEPG